MNFKFLLDENIPKSVYFSLKDTGYDVISISEKFRGIKDKEIIKISRKYKRIIITLDKDFGYLVFNQKKRPFGVILLRIHPQSPQKILSIILMGFKIIQYRKISLSYNYIVIDEQTIKSRKI
ncbi:DUF5615 family PIN-like protein [Candidatus Harpocratesius sp.]